MTAPSTGNMADWKAFADQTAEQQVTTVLDTLQAVVDTFGVDYVYVGGNRPGLVWPKQGACWYVKPDGLSPDCIAGHVLTRLGMPLAFLAANEQRSAGTVAEEFGGMCWQARNVLTAAQCEQDGTGSWWSALESARTCAARLRRKGDL